MAKAGSKPGARRYWCRKCGKEVILEEDDETLPPCPACGAEDYIP